MKLEEVLREFPSDVLKEALLEYLWQLHNVPKSHAFDAFQTEPLEINRYRNSSSKPTYPAYSRYPKEFGYFAKALRVGTKGSFISLLVSELGDLTQARRLLKRLNETNIIIEHEPYISPAAILCLFPKDMLEQVATKYKQSINKPSSGVFGSMRGKLNARQDVDRWALVKSLAGFIGDYDEHPVTVDTYTTFCPTCEKDNPDGADHCIHCGLLLPLAVCPHCGTKNVTEAKFCMSCGQVR